MIEGTGDHPGKQRPHWMRDPADIERGLRRLRRARRRSAWLLLAWLIGPVIMSLAAEAVGVRHPEFVGLVAVFAVSVALFVSFDHWLREPCPRCGERFFVRSGYYSRPWLRHCRWCGVRIDARDDEVMEWPCPGCGFDLRGRAREGKRCPACGRVVADSGPNDGRRLR